MAATKKIEEALAHIREAEKSLKTSLLKWKPDYDVAADEYNAAATCYKTAKQFTQCRECLLKAVENYKLNRSCLDQAALISKELGDLESIFTLCQRAACMYREHGIPDTAALSLEKGAKMIDTQLPEKALIMFEHAVDIVITEDRPRQAAEYQSRVSRLNVKMQKYDAATDAIRREICYHQAGENQPAIGRLTVALVLVQLARGDTVAAEKAFREWGSYCENEEVQTLEMLIQAFDEEDGDMAVKVLNSPFIKHMDVEYAKLARSLPVPKCSQETKKPGVTDTYPPYTSSSGADVDALAKGVGSTSISQNDEELDLC
ncbi:Gamma-soluble NSF attachment protein [Portunus trituberculatus]|uniref:Gamma-soluble NSF attachment protein n=1 Tax=Portunus trituberculatus TaxID=210409 RepID=A0A5B7DGC2_PORTR|nr:Gamma-soluble NSF attachment protein [Portunus trituberculatus]